MVQDFQAMETKEQELKSIALQCIPEVMEDRDVIAQQVVQHFVHLTPPESETPPFEVVTVRSGGLRGGTSRKPGNLILDWMGLLQLIASVVPSSTAVFRTPWLLPFVALNVWNTVQSKVAKELSPRHA